MLQALIFDYGSKTQIMATCGLYHTLGLIKVKVINEVENGGSVKQEIEWEYGIKGAMKTKCNFCSFEKLPL